MMKALSPAGRPRPLILGLALLVFQFSYAGSLLAANEEGEYASREAEAPEAADFRGGQSYDPDGISASSMVWVLVVAGIAVVLLIVLAMAGMYDGPSGGSGPTSPNPGGWCPSCLSGTCPGSHAHPICSQCDGSGRAYSHIHKATVKCGRCHGTGRY